MKSNIEHELFKVLANLNKEKDTYIGQILSVQDGVATIIGLPNVKAGELIEFVESNIKGMALNLNQDTIQAVIFGDDRTIKAGEKVKATNELLQFPVGAEMLGRIVDPLGNPLDGKGDFKRTVNQQIEVKAPGIISRKSVHEPMQQVLNVLIV